MVSTRNISLPSRPTGVSWNRRVLIFLWFTITITWACSHLIHGYHQLNLKGLHSGDSLDLTKRFIFPSKGKEEGHVKSWWKNKKEASKSFHRRKHKIYSENFTSVSEESEITMLEDNFEEFQFLEGDIANEGKGHSTMNAQPKSGNTGDGDSLSLEDENLRTILRDARLGSSDYSNSEALDKFWESSAGAGSERVEGEEGERVYSTPNTEIEKQESIPNRFVNFSKEVIVINKTAAISEKDSRLLGGISSNPENQISKSLHVPGDAVYSQTSTNATNQSPGMVPETTSKSNHGELQNGSFQSEGKRKMRVTAVLQVEPAGKRCASVEEMGKVTAGDTRAASLLLRRRIKDYMAEHGAATIRQLPPQQFCQRGFVLSQHHPDADVATHLYQVLNTIAFAVVLNRSVVLDEVSAHSAIAPPLLPLLDLSPQLLLPMAALEQLWASHGCHSTHRRPLAVHSLSLGSSNGRAGLLCRDWRKRKVPLIGLAHASNPTSLQWLLKSRHAGVRQLASRLLGPTWDPSARPNLFGELARVSVGPAELAREGVRWAQGKAPPVGPTIVLHLGGLEGKNWGHVRAAAMCAMKAGRRYKKLGKHGPNLLLTSCHPTVRAKINAFLGGGMQVIHFDHVKFAKEHPGMQNLSAVFARKHDGEEGGETPGWAAIVELFLASQLKAAGMVLGGSRVGSTIAQLAAAMAAANQLEDVGGKTGFTFLTSIPKSGLQGGLMVGEVVGSTWSTFSGSLSCPAQRRQCAVTPLLPYVWWDAPWQSPTRKAILEMKKLGLVMKSNGAVTRNAVKNFCEAHGQDAKNS